MGEMHDSIGLNPKRLDSSAWLALPSPCLDYQDGQIPPSLSPLDAFAAQSRLLAKQLDVKRAGEKRISRLPPAMVTKSLSQHRAHRPAVFRSLSEQSGCNCVKEEESPAQSPTMAHGHDRHVSQHPRLSSVPITLTDDDHMDGNKDFATPTDQSSTLEAATQPIPQSDYFGFLRTDSPVSAIASNNFNISPWQAEAEDSSDESHPRSRHQPHLRNGTSTTQLDQANATSPTLGFNKPHLESSDDDYTTSNAGSSFSYHRKLSSSSGISAPHSPHSPSIPVHPSQSPSSSLQASANAVPTQRPHLNFSRPRSTASLSFISRTNSPALQHPVDSQNRLAPVIPRSGPHMSTQTEDSKSVDHDGYLSESGSSYTYAKYALPRGRMLPRDSTIFQALSTPHFEWEEPLFQETPPTSLSVAPAEVAASSQPRLIGKTADRSKAKEDILTYIFRSERPTATEQPVTEQPINHPPQSLELARPATSATPSKTHPSKATCEIKPTSAQPTSKPEAEDLKWTTSSSDSTLLPPSTSAEAKHGTGHQYMSPDDHVTKGIECHENGSLQESTYHLRIAAMQNHPTAMLLYALACRHGWGMRPNQREGVQWLRKALDSAMLEVTEDEDFSSSSAIWESPEKKERRAQFALSVYELGVSHLKGWGVEQDKALALRCFEVAAQWGDTDALTEAGFCYAQGLGCKKDLKKAAKFYRQAEQRGVNMVGNSWIYKDKYNDATEMPRSQGSARSATPTKEKKFHDKSRTRNIFGRKKSFR